MAEEPEEFAVFDLDLGQIGTVRRKGDCFEMDFTDAGFLTYRAERKAERAAALLKRINEKMPVGSGELTEGDKASLKEFGL